MKPSPGKVPLIQALIDYRDKGYRPFHMPGHKQGAGQSRWFKELLGKEIFTLDLTELPGLDDLHQPQDVIQKAQRAAAQCFGAEESYFLINGSTVGVQAMLLATAGPEEEVWITRQAHRSTLAGLILSGSRPRYLPVPIDPVYQIPLALSVTEIQKRLEAALKTPNEGSLVRGLLVVHPNYYGITSDLSAIRQITREQNQVLLVDEAHGPHFYFHEALPISALEAGADVTVQSWHKVLTSLTQTALLHRQGVRVSKERLRRCLMLLQSSSPSYILMSSLDAARWQMQEEGRTRLEQTLELAEKARELINQIHGLSCLGQEVRQFCSVGDWDPTRLVIKVSGLGLTGYQAADILRQDYGLQVEMADNCNLLALITLGDDQAAINDLVEGLKDLAARWYNGKDKAKNAPWSMKAYPEPEVALTPREAFFWSRTRNCFLKEAEGEISAELICPYPPGIPLLSPGETITRAVIEIIEELQAAGATWQGPADPTLKKLEVLVL